MSSSPPLPPPVEPERVRLIWWPFAVAALAVVIAVIVVAVALGGNEQGPGTTSAESTTTPSAPGNATPSTVGPSSTVAAGAAGATPGGSWTLLVYFVADNNLEEAALGDLGELVELPGSESLSIVALVDRSAGFSEVEVPGVGNWESAKLLEIQSGAVVELEDLGEANLGDPDTLVRFLVDGVTRYPADHYAVVLWDHGSIAGVGADRSHDDVLTLPDLASGLEMALTQTGIERFDIVGFDACLMGALEVASWVSPYADYMIASENLVPNSGWDYRSFGYLIDYPAASPEGLGREIVAGFVETHGEVRPNATMSLLALDSFDAFRARLGDLAAVAASDMDRFAAVIGKERTLVIAFGGSPVPEEDPFMIDLGQFITQIGASDTALTGSAEAARQALDELIVMSGTGPAAAGATGLAAYFPPYEALYRPGYDVIAPPEWVGFLEAYFAAGGAIGVEEQPSFAAIGNEAAYEFTSIGLTVNASFDAASVDNIVEAVLFSGVVQDDGSIVFIGEDQGLFEGSLVLANYDLTTLVLSDGTDEAIAYQDVSFGGDLSIIALDIPVAYVAPGSESDEYLDLLLSIQYDVAADVLGAGFFIQEEAGTFGAFTPDPRGLIFPWLMVTNTDGVAEWTTLSETGLWADPALLTFEYVPLPTGIEVYSELVVFDYGGNSDFASVSVVIP